MHSNPLFRCLLAASLVLFWLLCTSPAQAARLALVVGNDQYQSISKLRNAVADAQTMGEAFRKAGYQVTVVTNVDLRVLKDELRAFRRRVRGGDEVVLYFSGHGVQLGAENFLLPVDVRSDTEDQVRDDGLALSAVLADLRTAKPGFTLAIIDACRDNPFEKAGKSIGGRGLGRPPSATGEMVLFAAGEGQQALDRLGPNDPVRNGLFTRVFVNEMQRPGLSIDQTLRNVRVEVNRLAQTVRHEQVPALYDQVLGTYYFYPPGVQVTEPVPDRPVTRLTTGPSAAEIEQQAWDAAKVANSEAGYRAYLSEYPQGRFASAARVAIASARPTPPIQPDRQVTQVLRPGSLIKDCADCPELVVITGGNFYMGSDAKRDYEKPIHLVNVKTFAMGKTEVTQAQWQSVMGNNPSIFKKCGPSCPVSGANWDSVQQFIQRLNAKTGQRYRLPSEAEWEYAARAGSQTEYSFPASEVEQHAWFKPNSGGSIKPTSQKKPNAFGLHDMNGNVSERVEDCWHDDYNGAPTDGSAWIKNCASERRVNRGGSYLDIWDSDVSSIRRNWVSPIDISSSVGFRLAKTLLSP
jgi:formylglycine-generating enzyme required for sulfatase activity